MNITRSLVSRFALIALAFAPALPASTRPPVAVAPSPPGKRLAFDTRKFMPVSEVRPGMRGYALTVFKGTKIEKFGIEILGVLAKFNEGKDYILFRALDGPPVTRHLNIAHGMSGSPIYINGRLVGAISMGIPGTQFGRDPVALATPIENMLEAWSPDLPTKLPTFSASPNSNSLVSPGLDSRYPMSAFQPLDLPLTVSGMNRQGLSRLNTALAPYHFTVMAGGGGGASAASNPLAQNATLLPGSAVGVSLVQGDIDVSATGTVTYRDGNRLLLFGHPFTGLGPVDAALTTAYVVDIYPSYQDSVKLGSPIKTVGRIFQDRPFSVGGVIGSMPQMVPMTVAVHDESLHVSKTYHVRVINHPLLTAQFVSQVADQAIMQVHGQPGDSIATVTMDADVEEVGHVHRTNTYYDGLSIDQAAIADVDSLTRLLSSNSFYPLALRSLNLNVTIRNSHDTAEIDHLFVTQSKYAPGDTVNVGVVLKPYKRDPITRFIAVKIPASTPNGPLSLSVRGGGSEGGGGGISIGGLIFGRTSEPLPPAPNVKELIKSFTEKARNNELIARLTLPTTAFIIRGQRLSAPPPTLAGALDVTRTSSLLASRDEVKVVQPTGYVVSGSQNLSILVQRKSVSESPSASGSVPSGSAPAPSSSSPSSSSSASASDDSSDSSAVSDTTSLHNDAPNYLSAWLDAPVIKKSSTVNADAKVPGKTATLPEPDAKPSAVKEGDDPKPMVKTVGRLPSVWRQAGASEFGAGTLQNVALSSTGELRLAPALHKLGGSADTYAWALLTGKDGTLYAGTGNRGIVYKVSNDGVMTPWFESGELEITALAQDDAGTVYAGTAPHGIVYAISPDGKGHSVFKAQENYITALAYDTVRHRLLATTGGGTGRVYSVLDGTAPLFTSPEAHLLSLAVGKDGSIFAGSSPNGIVYKIAPDGKASVYYDTPATSIASLTLDSQGNLYAGTTKSALYKITPDGTAKLLTDKATGSILTLRSGPNDLIYACAGNTVYQVSPDETIQSFVAPTDEQFLSLAVSPNGQVYAGTGTVAAIYSIGTGSAPSVGTFQSAVHDAGQRARWGTLAWNADAPPGTRVTLQTRSGDVERPDASWSAWSPASASPQGQGITSPPGRYLQYQATLTADAGATAAPRLRDVTAYYLPRNQAPTAKIVKPSGGEAFSKTATLQWTARDPDNDTLTYELSYSPDSGKTWKPISKKPAPKPAPTAVAAAPKAPAAPGPITEADVARQVEKMRVELYTHPEIPEAAKQQLMQSAPAIARQILTRERAQTLAGNAETAATNGALKETSFPWDTTQVPDGVYQVRVIASDKTSNPSDALTAKAVSNAFVVANTLPTLTLGKPSVGTDKTVTVHGSVHTPSVFVKAVQYTIDGGDPSAAVADDGLFDSPQEAFTLVTAPLTVGTHTIEVQAIDRAGNTAIVKGTVVVK